MIASTIASITEEDLNMGQCNVTCHIKTGTRMEHGCGYLQALTEGIHTKEALDLVREHVRGIMGPAAVAFSNAMIKMSRLQAAQVISSDEVIA
jgi:hypothetical protein